MRSGRSGMRLVLEENWRRVAAALTLVVVVTAVAVTVASAIDSGAHAAAAAGRVHARSAQLPRDLAGKEPTTAPSPARHVAINATPKRPRIVLPRTRRRTAKPRAVRRHVRIEHRPHEQRASHAAAAAQTPAASTPASDPSPQALQAPSPAVVQPPAEATTPQAYQPAAAPAAAPRYTPPAPAPCYPGELGC